MTNCLTFSYVFKLNPNKIKEIKITKGINFFLAAGFYRWQPRKFISRDGNLTSWMRSMKRTKCSHPTVNKLIVNYFILQKYLA